MKDISTDMRTHLSGTVTSLATCWKLTREDGTVFAFTSHDRDLVVDGITFSSSSSFDRSAIDSDATMAVGNLEIQGFFDDEALKADELRAGLFDRAEVEVFIVNWANLTMGKIHMRRGWLGEVTLTPSGIFKSEIRGLIQAIQQNIGTVYTTQCRADLGDSRCKIPVNPPVLTRSFAVHALDHYRVADPDVTPTPDDGASIVYRDVIFQVIQKGTTATALLAPTYTFTPGDEITDGTAVLLCVEAWSRYGVVGDGGSDGQNFKATWPYGHDPRIAGGALSGGVPSPDTWFNDGILTWETGPNKGLAIEVQFSTGVTPVGMDTGTAFALHLPMGYPITFGDAFRVYAGCSKLIGVKPAVLQTTSVYGTFAGTTLTIVDPDGCKPKFDNAVNYRGEPFIPGVDFVVGSALPNQAGFSSGGGKK